VLGLVAGLVLALVVAALPAGALAAAPPVPALRWSDCGGGFQCATAAVPLDYQLPLGRTISLALIKLPASDPARRIGSLFVDPGGPGASGVQFVRLDGALIPAEVRARFDVIGFDPRGVAASAPLRCFASTAAQQAFFQNVPAFPVGPQEDLAFVRTFERYDALCARRNADLLPHVSTANAARDLDLLRQAVGDGGLSYLGLSYGTYLGATYANLFPERVRSMVLDGAIDPVEWATGRGDESRTEPFSTRLRSDQGASATLDQFLDLCAVAGTQSCAFAAASEQATRDKFDDLLRGLLEHPQGTGSTAVTYALVVLVTLVGLDSPSDWPFLGTLLQEFEPPAGGSALPACGACWPRLLRRRTTTARTPSRRSRAPTRTIPPVRSRGPRRPSGPTVARRSSAPRGRSRRSSARPGAPGTRPATRARGTGQRPARCWSSATGSTPPPRTRAPSRSAASWRAPVCSR
jgi:pimeloyl-ACP methyl ester carboxylesterase